MLKKLNKDEILNIAVEYNKKNKKSTAELKEWTEFVISAIEDGVSQTDIDSFVLSEENFIEKYKPKKQKLENIEKQFLNEIYSVILGYRNNIVSLFQDDATMEYIVSVSNAESKKRIKSSSSPFLNTSAHGLYDSVNLKELNYVDANKTYKMLKNLMGFIQNGSDVVLDLMFDEKENMFSMVVRDVKIRDKFFDVSFEKLIEKAYNKRKSLYE